MPRVYCASPSEGPIRQGEILSGLTELRAVGPTSEEDGDQPAEVVKHPFAVVLTQDCDLDFDFKARQPATTLPHKLLPNILLAELWLAEQLRGKHDVNHGVWKRVKQNMDERYHFLPRVEPEDDALGKGFDDDLTIDFKRLFTIGAETLYTCIDTTAQRRSCLQSPFMQDLSNRFGYYQIRVALPEIETESSQPAARRTFD